MMRSYNILGREMQVRNKCLTNTYAITSAYLKTTHSDCKSLESKVYGVVHMYIHSWSLQPFSHDYGLLCVLILYESGRAYSLTSTPNDFVTLSFFPTSPASHTQNSLTLDVIKSIK